MKWIFKYLISPILFRLRGIAPRTRILFGLSSIVFGTVMLASGCGFFPDPYREVMRHRASFCESLAVSGTVMMIDRNTDGFAAALHAIVLRNDDVVSAGLRHADGTLLFSSGPHTVSWTGREGDASSENEMVVPVFQDSKKWGNLEVVFEPYGGWMGLDRWAPAWFLLFFVPAAYLQFSFFIRKVLQHLDPQGAVPKHVREALDNLAEGLLLLDNGQRILLANRAIAAVLGVPPERLVGRDVSQLGWEAESGSTLPWSVSAEEGQTIAKAIVHLSINDHRCTFSVNSTPILGHDGKYRGVMVTFDDITAFEENKARLAEARDAAEKASQEKSSFLANMSHEIRTPMNAIVGFSDVLRRGLEHDPDKQLEYLDTIHTSGNHLIDLINDILDLSKIEAGKLEIESQTCSIYKVVADVVNVLQIRARDRGIDLRAMASSEIPERITTDCTRLRQILVNLVGNAIKFTDEGEVVIHYGVESRDGKTMIRFNVIDSGIGMTEEHQGKIFQEFVQADSSVTRRFGGTGLGLAISKRLAEALGGGISVKSQIGVGSVFTVHIDPGPLKDTKLLGESEVERLAKREKRAKTQSGIVQLQPCRILVVDDTPANRDLVSAVLGKAGAEVVEAENGQDALDKVDQCEFDLIFMDMQMPIMDGYTATARLKEGLFTGPIVALTGNALKQDAEKCFAAGCSHFLTKPINIDKLLALVGEIVGVAAEPHDDGSPAPPPLPAALPAERIPASSDSPGTGIHSKLPVDIPEFHQIVERFIDEIDASLETMRTALDASDFETLARRAHALKGTGGTVGFPQFTEPASALERYAQAGAAAEAAEALRTIENIVSRLQRPCALQPA